MTYYVPEVVESFPAYDVIKPRVCSLTNLPVFKDDDTVGVKAPRGYYRQYQFGSVVSYALQNGDDPLAAYNLEVERGYYTHWLNACAVSLSSSKTEKKTIYEINVGDVVLFEGIVFEVAKAPNDNLKLIKIDTKADIINRRIEEHKSA